MKTGMERIGVSTEYLESASNAFASSIDRLKDFIFYSASAQGAGKSQKVF